MMDTANSNLQTLTDLFESQAVIRETIIESESDADSLATLDFQTPDETLKGQLKRIQVALEEGRTGQAVTMLERFSGHNMSENLRGDYLSLIEYTAQAAFFSSSPDLVGRLYDMGQDDPEVMNAVIESMDLSQKQKMLPKLDAYPMGSEQEHSYQEPQILQALSFG